MKNTPVPWGVFLFAGFEVYTPYEDKCFMSITNGRYTVAIRQAPHPLLSSCALMTQIRRLLACEFVLLVLNAAPRISTFKYAIFVF